MDAAAHTPSLALVPGGLAPAVSDTSRDTAADQAAAPSDIAARLERLPMTGYQRRVFAIIASAWLVDQVDVALLTFLLASITVEFGLSPTQAGQLVGNLVAGTASDRFGRRMVFQATMVVWGMASLAAAAAWSVGALMACRFMIGVGVGGEAPVAQARRCCIDVAGGAAARGNVGGLFLL